MEISQLEVTTNTGKRTCLVHVFGMVNGPPKIESLGKFYPSLGISQNFIKGLGVSDLVSVGHTYIYMLFY